VHPLVRDVLARSPEILQRIRDRFDVRIYESQAPVDSNPGKFAVKELMQQP
jgi:hypothetical protein